MSLTPSYRSGFAQRGSRQGWNKSFPNAKRDTVKPDIHKNPLGEHLKTFENSELEVDSNTTFVDTAVSDLRYVASYNWRSGDSATILVPGKPPQWTPVQDAQRLNEDSGQYYRDPNAARYPEYPMAPVIRSILHHAPSFSTADTDIVACGSTLGNLLRFVRGQDKAFRFTVQAIGNTVFLVRKENDPKETIPGVRGYGHSFPEANTTWENDVKNSETHQRIVKYNFAGLECLVRYECDGYFKDTTVRTDSTTTTDDGTKPLADDDALVSAVDSVTIDRSAMAGTYTSTSLTVEQCGGEVPQHSIFELKTRSGRYKTEIDMSDIYPQLWIKQIPNFIVAYHDGAGLFRDVRVQDIRADVATWEEDNADAIRRLASLLHQLVAFAKEDRGLLEVYSPGKDCLEVRRQYGEGTQALPADLREEWAGGCEVDNLLSDSDDGGYAYGRDDSSPENWDADSDEDEPDYTACSSEDCGYCGKCTY